jgi:hypothetical protein
MDVAGACLDGVPKHGVQVHGHVVHRRKRSPA